MFVKKLSIKWKVAILVVAFVAAGIAVTVFFTGYKTQSIIVSETKRATLSGYRDTVLNTLTTLMLAGNIKETKGQFLEQMQNIVDIRVVRSEILDKEYGKGQAEEYASDSIEKEVIETGKERVVLDGQYIRGVYPYIAKSNLMGKNCLSCHGVGEGTVLGAISIKIPLVESFQRIRFLQYVHVLLGLFGLLTFTGLVLAIIVRDTAQRRQLQDAIIRSRDELEQRVQERTLELKTTHDRSRSLAAHLQSVREEERMRIAREIHDELGQALTAQKMELSWLQDKYGDHKQISDKAGFMLSMLDSMIKSVRRICTELRPSILDDFGLVEAMKWQADEFQRRTGIECVVEAVPEEILLDKELTIALFRIFQEALTNILKHAGANRVTVRVTKDDDNITLEVIDNGRGVTDKQLSKPQSFGLIGMRERIYPWGGEVKITGHKNVGTTLTVIIPLSNKNNF